MRFSISHLHRNGWDSIHLIDSEERCYADIVPEAGAILNGLGSDNGQNSLGVIAGYQSKNDWETSRQEFYRSAKLTPFVCRIANGKFHWHEQQFQLKTNPSHGHAMHGLVAHERFSVIEESAHPEFAEVTLLRSYHGTDPGFPFSFDCFVRYRLSPSKVLSVHTAIHNRSPVTIPVADGWHCYFRLGDNVNALRLTIRSKEKFEYNEDLVPTGRFIADDRWYNGKEIGDTVLDNCYVPDAFAGQPVCSLKNPTTGQEVEVYPGKGYPFLQVYIPPDRDSISIEPLSAPPDVFNNSIGLISLDPDHTATFDVEYKLKQV
ncbi:hypothetical protein [Pollutibacter soli]|uniref:aldose 1-epimerase n=1 Tax=Pollutibacter soli TaxID=3034157 RepID=UPI003013B8E9